MKWSLVFKGCVAVFTLSTFAACQSAEPEGDGNVTSNASGDTGTASVVPEPAIESEAKTAISAMSRGQQAFYLENQVFAGTIEEIGIGLDMDTPNYAYTIVSADDKTAKITAAAKVDGASSFTSLVVAEEGTTKSVICETDEPSQTPPDITEITGCPAGSSEI